MERNVLIIGNFWPYRSGGARIDGLANCLNDFDWHPIIVTNPLEVQPKKEYDFVEVPKDDGFPEAGDVVRSGLFARFIQSARTKIGSDPESLTYAFASWVRLQWLSIAHYPDQYKNWSSYALLASRSLIKKRKVGAIISTSPVTAHVVASRLKQEFQLPWVADFPDLWSQNHFYPYGEIRGFFERRLEKKTLMYADAITTLSDPWKERLQLLHKKNEIYAITHGFDPDTFEYPKQTLPDKFTISYTGSIYKRQQDIRKFFCALKDLLIDGTIKSRDIEVRFFGSNLDFINSEAGKFGLSKIVNYYGKVSAEKAIAEQRRSHVLLLLNLEDPSITGCHTLKLFAYAAAKRPILVTGGVFNGNVIEDFINRTKSGCFAPSVDDIKVALKSYYEEYKKTGVLAYKGDLEIIKAFSHKEMAKKFSQILNDLVLDRKSR